MQYPLLSKKGISVPKVLKFDDSLNLIKHPYLIISEIEGERLSDSFGKLLKDELSSSYYELGKIIAKIHSFSFEAFGETYDGKTVTGFSEIGGKGPFKSWKEMHKEIVDHRLSYFKGTYFQDLIEPIRLWFKSRTHLIDYNITPRLLHIDINKKNIFIKNNKITGIIDFDDAFVGHNEEDLMRTESAIIDGREFKDSFFIGYTELIELDENYEQRKIFYYLSRLLVHIDCVIKYGNKYVKNVGKEQEIIRKEINNILTEKPVNFNKNKKNT